MKSTSASSVSRTVLGSLKTARRAPGSFGLDQSYRNTAAFITGFDTATGSRLLAGFRSWLIETLPYRETNLSWDAIVAVYCVPDYLDNRLTLAQSEEKVISDKLFLLVIQFVEETGRDRPL